jgi:hypothetical protein
MPWQENPPGLELRLLTVFLPRYVIRLKPRDIRLLPEVRAVFAVSYRDWN